MISKSSLITFKFYKKKTNSEELLLKKINTFFINLAIATFD